MKKLILTFLIMCSLVSFAQDENSNKPDLQAGFDLATTYLWRGFEIGNGPVIQPWAQISLKGVTAGIWSTTNYLGDSKEVDVFLKYGIRNFTFSFTDLYSVGVPGMNTNYFDFRNAFTGHVSEFGISWGGTEKFPFIFSGGMLMYGLALDPRTDDASKLNHSMYFEAAYYGKIRDYTYNIFAGFVPTASIFYQTDKFSFINLGFKAGKVIQITDKFSVPVNLTLAVSPVRKTSCLAVMCSF